MTSFTHLNSVQMRTIGSNIVCVGKSILPRHFGNVLDSISRGVTRCPREAQTGLKESSGGSGDLEVNHSPVLYQKVTLYPASVLCSFSSERKLIWARWSPSSDIPAPAPGTTCIVRENPIPIPSPRICSEISLGLLPPLKCRLHKNVGVHLFCQEPRTVPGT